MDITDIFDMGRELAYVTSSRYTNADLLKYANKRYQIIQNAIVNKVNENYFYDIFSANTVADQSEYTLKNSTSLLSGIKKMISVSIKNKSTDEYTKISEWNSNLSIDSIDQLASDGNYEQFYQIRDGSIFIYPAPTESVSNGLKIEALISLPDLTVTSVSTAIFPKNTELREYHYIIAQGLRADIFALQGLFDKKDVAEAEFNDSLNLMIYNLNGRNNSDLESSLPNGRIYK